MSATLPPMWEYRARITAVVDGDTLDLDVDLGLEVHTTQRVRLVGINAPEKNTPEGKAAKAWVETWVTGYPPETWFTVRTTKDRREKYGRYLAAVAGPDGADLSTDALKTGHAYPWDGKGTRPTQ